MKKVALLGAAAVIVIATAAAYWLWGRPNAGSWVFSQSEDGTQAFFLRHPQAVDETPLVRIACNDADGVLWFNIQSLPSEEVEKRAEARRKLDMTVQAEGRSLVLEGYVTRAPEGASISYEVPRDAGILQALSALDFALSAPGLWLKGGAPALAEFVRACPPLARPSGDRLQWGTRTSLENGYRIDIPRALFRIAWGDRMGRSYESETGNAALIVMGGPDAMQAGLATALKEGTAGLPALDRETYRSVGRQSAVVSGYSGDTIVYYKARLTCGGANVAYFLMTYDASARQTFDPIVTRMAKSFDTTSLPDGRPLCP